MNKLVCIILCASTLFFLNIFSINVTSNAEDYHSEIIIEAKTNRVLHSVNPDVERPIASLTKIMTAIVVIENADITKDFTIPAESVGVEGSSVYLKQNEVYRVEDLLYGLMLRSGNDCAIALAKYTSGSVENFVKKMNEKSKELMLKNTLFTNPHGLHNDKHLSSARDVATIFAYAMNNDIFRKIVSSKSYVATEKTSKESKVFNNKNKLLYNYNFCTGGKTGYTKISGRCLAASANKDGMELISVVLGCSKTYEITQANFKNAYEKFSMVKLCEPKDFYYETDIDGGREKCKGYIKKDFIFPLSNNERKLIKTKIKPIKNLRAPLKIDEKIGFLEIYIENQLIFSQNIYTIIGVEKKFDVSKVLKDWRIVKWE